MRRGIQRSSLKSDWKDAEREARERAVAVMQWIRPPRLGGWDSDSAMPQQLGRWTTSPVTCFQIPQVLVRYFSSVASRSGCFKDPMKKIELSIFVARMRWASLFGRGIPCSF